jgi:hypothetical protein
MPHERRGPKPAGNRLRAREDREGQARGSATLSARAFGPLPRIVGGTRRGERTSGAGEANADDRAGRARRGFGCQGVRVRLQGRVRRPAGERTGSDRARAIVAAREPRAHANDADIERFATTEEGAQLVKEWGRDVGRKLAIVCARLDRMLLNGGDMDAALEWFEDLTSAEAKSILTALAHGR